MVGEDLFRYGMEASLAGVPFEVVQIDVTATAPELWQVEPAQRTVRSHGERFRPESTQADPIFEYILSWSFDSLQIAEFESIWIP